MNYEEHCVVSQFLNNIFDKQVDKGDYVIFNIFWVTLNLGKRVWIF